MRMLIERLLEKGDGLKVKFEDIGVVFKWPDPDGRTQAGVFLADGCSDRDWETP